ncbi:hypothetical protein G3N30_13260 [Microbacterium lacticum]|uniref:hypothetical protein n=1 Tax=Microbacterium lacticum TaxID=33885 RepID=UPI0018B05325|nr:hypothetical protein [Microbacterium lacticum]MBF9337145.1 hypothetical protein [Microbacterium lacticum]
MKRTAATTALAVGAVIALSACVPGPGADAAPTAMQTPTPTETTPAYEAGTVVDVVTATEMNADREGQYRAYPMPDGTNIVIERTAPLPDAVQADVNSKGEALAQQYPKNTDIHTPRGQQAVGEQVGAITQATGKKVILVIRENGYDYDGNAITNYYPTGQMGPDGTIRSKAELEANINAFLADKNANEYVVVWPN